MERQDWSWWTVEHFTVDAVGRVWRVIGAGIIPFRQSAVNTLTAWANDCERKLLRLHCGQMLERSRHRAWAERMVVEKEV